MNLETETDGRMIGKVVKQYELYDTDYALVELKDNSIVRCRVGGEEGHVFVDDGSAYVNSFDCEQCGEAMFKDEKEKEWYCPIHG